MDFSPPLAAAIARSPWNDFRLNMNGNIIYQVPSPARRSYGIHIHKGGNISGNWKVFLWWFHVLCLAPLARSLLSAHPVISLVMWEWWSRDNGTLSFHMRQEDSLQALTCFSTGEWIASCYLHVPASQQLSVLHFVFITGFHLQSFISAGAATHRTQSSIAKYDRDLS